MFQPVKLTDSLPDWAEVQYDEVWSPYLAKKLEYDYRSNREEESIIVGNEACLPDLLGSVGARPVTREYCNGPLKEDALYLVKIRACSSQSSVCVESDFVREKPHEGHISYTAHSEGKITKWIS